MSKWMDGLLKEIPSTKCERSKGKSNLRGAMFENESISSLLQLIKDNWHFLADFVEKKPDEIADPNEYRKMGKLD
jgi:hypothetical protein